MYRKFLASFVAVAFLLMMVSPALGQDRRRRSKLGPKAKVALTAAAGTGIGAGLGALLGGRRGAAAGALLGGGGTTAFYLAKNRRDRRALGRYGQPIATIASGTAIGAGVGTLAGGKKGAGIGALLGGGGTTAGYLIATRNRTSRSNVRNTRYYRRR